MPERRGSQRTVGPLNAVADAGPPIHLDELGAARAFEVFERVLVPEPVNVELERLPDRPGAGLAEGGPFEIVDLSGSEKDGAERLDVEHGLGVIDASVLSVASARRIPLVLTDDLEVRDVAKLVGLRPVGSIGILLRAATRGVLAPDEVDETLVGLVTSSSLFVTPSLVDRARQALRDAADRG